MKKNLYFKVMSLVSAIIILTFIFVNFYVLNSFRDRLIQQVPKSAVETAYSIIDFYGKSEDQKKLTDKEAQLKAKDVISNLRLDDGSYFWIHTLDLKMIMHPIKPALNDTILNNLKTPDGRVLFADMNEVVRKNNGQGWHNYLWPKPGKERPEEKTSYIKLYKKWNWVVGSGMYVEDVKDQMKEFFTKIQIALAVIFISSLVVGHFISRKISITLLKVSGDVSKTAINLNNVTIESQGSVSTLSQIAIEQASAIEETAASAHEISMIAEQNSKNASEALGFSENNRAISTEGRNALERLEKSINEIEESISIMISGIEKNNSRFDDIYKIIEEIASKTKVINDIVFQTKLLSFNASVEAARAGEQGKGFAVVAEEIGKLALVSGEAAKEINSLIAQSSERINIIVSGSKDITTSLSRETQLKMTEGHQTSQEFSIIFDKMIINIEKINSSIKEMSNASREQGEGIVQINTALNQLSEAGNLNMNATENIKTKIEELALDADNLNRSVQLLEQEVKG